MLFTKKDLKQGVDVAGSIAVSGGSNPVLECIRITNLNEKSLVFIGCDGSNVISWYVPATGIQKIDVCVHAKRLKAAVEACHGRQNILVKETKTGLSISQQGGPRALIKTQGSQYFPGVPAFDKMEHIYEGPNPKDGLTALRHEAVTNAGVTPLYEVVVFMLGASYAMRPGITVRCEFSLVDRETELTPIPVAMKTATILRHFGEHIRCMADQSRLLIVDKHGYAVLRRSAIDVGVFPEEAKIIFGSLKSMGDIRVAVANMLPVIKSAVSILGGIYPNTPLYLMMESSGETLKITGEVEGQTYTESVTVVSTGDFKIPIEANRLLSFLKSSADEQVAIRVMNSPKIPDPMKFVHLVDSRLHEVVGIRDRIEQVRQEAPPDA